MFLLTKIGAHICDIITMPMLSLHVLAHFLIGQLHVLTIHVTDQSENVPCEFFTKSVRSPKMAINSFLPVEKKNKGLACIASAPIAHG